MRRAKKPPPELPNVIAPALPVGITPVPRPPAVFRDLDVQLTPIEEDFARLFILYNNATRAYVESAGHTGSRNLACSYAWAMSNRPHVRKRIREYESAAAAATIIDYAAILENDRQIVEGYQHADKISQHIWQCCRYCHGTEHKYQWIDFAEYLAALGLAEEKNDERRLKQLRELTLPTDDGGYGFIPTNEPNLTCPQCEGRGKQVTVIADTTKLEGPARAIVKGVKVTSSGIEVLLHDVDKAKERLLRAGGYFGDDAASVARGAAAGAAAGATAAIAAAKAADEMTAEQVQRLYLELA